MKLYYREIDPLPQTSATAAADDEKTADKADVAKADSDNDGSCKDKESREEANQEETGEAHSAEAPIPKENEKEEAADDSIVGEVGEEQVKTDKAENSNGKLEDSRTEEESSVKAEWIPTIV